MTVPQMPAANAASSATNRKTARGRCENDLVPAGVALPVECTDVRIGPEIVAGENPLAAAALAREVRGGLRRGADADEQDEDTGRGTDGAQESFARDVEHVGDTGADVVG